MLNLTYEDIAVWTILWWHHIAVRYEAHSHFTYLWNHCGM